MQYEIGKRALETGSSYVNEQLERVDYGKIRKYFHINDEYIAKKLLLILCPFYKGGAAGVNIYKADLYIPLMAMISLILYNGFYLGIMRKFHPEVLI
ncbi:hypothetical protein ENBRE01_2023, partial [Enteropsectra breve]